MPGTATTVGVVGCIAALTMALASVAAATVVGQRLAGVADASALAAADAASGAIPGVPCERAEEVAAAGGAAIRQCDLEGLIATVAVAGRFGHVVAVASARAGPPPPADPPRP